MLLQRVYKMALEHPGIGFVGIVGRVGEKEPSLEALSIFIRGFEECLRELQENSDCSWTNFEEWLRSREYFPSIGWAAKIISETGDGLPAYDRFKELLFEYLETEKPEWFIEFNKSDQPSAWYSIKCDDGNYEKATSTPSKSDIRFSKHINIAVGKA